MALPFRVYHSICLLRELLKFETPSDLLIHQYFKTHKALGSKDRAFIAKSLYKYLKWLPLIEEVQEGKNLEQRLSFLEDFDPKDYEKNPSLKEHIKLAFPEELYSKIVESHGLAKAKQICLASNQEAPTTIRANPDKISRDSLLGELPRELGANPGKLSPYAIHLTKRENLFQLPAFKNGHFEVQDEGSQLIALLAKIQKGHLVLDFCAGSGGKSLAFAHLTEGKGQMFIHDVRPKAIAEAKKRFKRAGVQNVQFVLNGQIPKNLKKKFDWVYVDAPCSGTGTLRRNPDMKYRFCTDFLQDLLKQQRSIFEQALSYVKPGGHIIYATCSLLNEENQQQEAFFLERYPLEKEGESFQSVPQPGQMDGFFACIFKRQAEEKSHRN